MQQYYHECHCAALATSCTYICVIHSLCEEASFPGNMLQCNGLQPARLRAVLQLACGRLRQTCSADDACGPCILVQSEKAQEETLNPSADMQS